MSGILNSVYHKAKLILAGVLVILISVLFSVKIYYLIAQQILDPDKNQSVWSAYISFVLGWGMAFTCLTVFGVAIAYSIGTYVGSVRLGIKMPLTQCLLRLFAILVLAPAIPYFVVQLLLIIGIGDIKLWGAVVKAGVFCFISVLVISIVPKAIFTIVAKPQTDQ